MGCLPWRSFLALVALSGWPSQTSRSPFKERSVYLAHLRHQSNVPFALRGWPWTHQHCLRVMACSFAQALGRQLVPWKALKLWALAVHLLHE